MQIHTLENEHLQVQISTIGAEWQHILNKEYNVEYLWQGGEHIWARKAPVLFPIVGKAFNNSLLIDGKTYAISQHGFARDAEFSVVEKTDTEARFSLATTAATLPIYPYLFTLHITYQLVARTLHTHYTVINEGETPLCFSIGAHPGFNLPTKNLDDYYLEFEKEEPLVRYLLTDGLFNGQTEELQSDGKRLPLSVTLFEKDALVFKHLQSEVVTLKQYGADFAVQLRFTGFPYLGIWTKPHTQEFVCIEPWCGIADSNERVLPIAEKQGIVQLQPREVFERTFATTFIK